MYRFKEGTSPLLVSIPHGGTHIPAPFLVRMTPVAARLDDTDWHLERLYDFLDDLGASVIAATHSRYVVDLNRPPDNASLYPGHDVIGLVPLDTAARERLYPPGREPDEKEIAYRVETFWQPYHSALEKELDRLRTQHGYALLWDAHSIASLLPRFFQGKLPDLNFGTADGMSCAPGTGERLFALGRNTHTAVLNGRYKGGYITRRYGNPAKGVHAVQLELAQCTYMEELKPPYRFLDDSAARLRPVLKQLLQVFLKLGQTTFV